LFWYDHKVKIIPKSSNLLSNISFCDQARKNSYHFSTVYVSFGPNLTKSVEKTNAMPCDASCSSYAKHHFRGCQQKPKVILDFFYFFCTNNKICAQWVVEVKLCYTFFLISYWKKKFSAECPIFKSKSEKTMKERFFHFPSSVHP
jgi:hypothetical protein